VDLTAKDCFVVCVCTNCTQAPNSMPWLFSDENIFLLISPDSLVSVSAEAGDLLRANGGE
jgi:hypothetical protein